MSKIFSSNGNVEKNAYLNWRTDRDKDKEYRNMNVLAEGYMKSAIVIAEKCLENNINKDADILIFPMLFSVNHGIELYLKSIFWSLNTLLKNEEKFKRGHDILKIWKNTKEKIINYGFNDTDRREDNFFSMIINLENYLEELSEKTSVNNEKNTIKNIEFSRYPILGRDEIPFYITDFQNVVIDLENFLEIVKDINRCLNSLANYYWAINEYELDK